MSLQQRTAADLDDAIRRVRSNGFGDGLDLPFMDTSSTSMVKSVYDGSLLHTHQALEELAESVSKDMKLTEDVFQIANLPRATKDEQRTYLMKACTTINAILNNGLDGRYDLPFFTQEHGSSSSYRWFRSWLQCAAEDYRRKMESNGHKHYVVPDGEEGSASTAEVNLHDSCETPARVSLMAYSAAIERHLNTHRSSELPGNCRWDQVGTIFRMQAVSWAAITDEYITKCMLGAGAFVRQVVTESAPRQAAALLNETVVEPALRQIETDLRSKVKELIRPYQGSRPLTLTSHFLRHKSEVAKRFTTPSDKETSEQTGSTLNSMTAEVVLQMLTYYDIALLVYVDNVYLLGVENILADRLSTLFLPEKVLTMPEDVLTCVADGADEAELELKAIKSRLDGIRHAQQSYKKYVCSLDMEISLVPLELQPAAVTPPRTEVSRNDMSLTRDQSSKPQGQLLETPSANLTSVLREDKISHMDATSASSKSPVTPTRTQQSQAPELGQDTSPENPSVEGKALQGAITMQDVKSNDSTLVAQKEVAKTTLGPDFSIVTPPITPLKQAGRAATVSAFGNAISYGRSMSASAKSEEKGQATYRFSGAGGQAGNDEEL